MLKEPAVRIPWAGRRALREARQRLHQGEDIVLELPLAVHHALAVRLRPQQATRESEPLVQQGGVELLEAVADIAGLEEVATLAPLLRNADWTVTVASPHPRLIVRRR